MVLHTEFSSDRHGLMTKFPIGLADRFAGMRHFLKSLDHEPRQEENCRTPAES